MLVKEGQVRRTFACAHPVAALMAWTHGQKGDLTCWKDGVLCRSEKAAHLLLGCQANAFFELHCEHVGIGEHFACD